MGAPLKTSRVFIAT